MFKHVCDNKSFKDFLLHIPIYFISISITVVYRILSFFGQSIVFPVTPRTWCIQLCIVIQVTCVSVRLSVTLVHWSNLSPK